MTAAAIAARWHGQGERELRQGRGRSRQGRSDRGRRATAGRCGARQGSRGQRGRDGGRKGGGSGAVGSRWRPLRRRPTAGRRGPGRGRRSRQEGGRRQCGGGNGGAVRRFRPAAASEADRKALAANAAAVVADGKAVAAAQAAAVAQAAADEADKRRKRRFPFPTQAYSPAWPRWKAALRRWPMRRFRTSRRLPYGTMPTGTNCPSVLAMMDSSCA